MVMAHLKKEGLPRRRHTELHMKNIGPFQILKQCDPNAYKIDLPPNVGLLPIFNVSNIYAYKTYSPTKIDDLSSKDMFQDLPRQNPPSTECILENRIRGRLESIHIMDI